MHYYQDKLFYRLSNNTSGYVSCVIAASAHSSVKFNCYRYRWEKNVEENGNELLPVHGGEGIGNYFNYLKYIFLYSCVFSLPYLMLSKNAVDNVVRLAKT